MAEFRSYKSYRWWLIRPDFCDVCDQGTKNRRPHDRRSGLPAQLPGTAHFSRRSRGMISSPPDVVRVTRRLLPGRRFTVTDCGEARFRNSSCAIWSGSSRQTSISLELGSREPQTRATHVPTGVTRFKWSGVNVNCQAAASGSRFGRLRTVLCFTTRLTSSFMRYVAQESERFVSIRRSAVRRSCLTNFASTAPWNNSKVFKGMVTACGFIHWWLAKGKGNQTAVCDKREH